MESVLLFRVDDISWDINYGNFAKIRDIFQKYDVKPIIGVIPCNEDTKIKGLTNNKGMSESDFWPMVRELQRESGWAIAQHGYNHVYETDDWGILRINARSEFAGLSYDVQYEKIKRGNEILRANGIKTDLFMAPAHSFDWTTIEALKANGIFTVTDGLAKEPYILKNVLFVPQVSPWPNTRSRGVQTSCFHINSWGNEQFDKLEDYIFKNKQVVASFQDVIEKRDSYVNGDSLSYYLSHTQVVAKRIIRKAGSKIKHMLIK